MNILTRAMISIKRQPGKALIFTLVITILGAMTAGSISIVQTINQTDANLRQRMPAIMMVQARMENDDDLFEAELPVLTSQLIRSIAELPYVGVFDYAIDVGHWSTSVYGLAPWSVEGIYWPIMIGGYQEGRGSILSPRGVSTPNFFAARDGLLTLVAGRTFTELELSYQAAVTPIIISAELARINNLHVGDQIDSRFMIRDYAVDEEVLLVDRIFPMVVIGLFDADLPMIPTEVETGFPILNMNARVHHRIYLPNLVAEEMFNLRIRYEQWWDDDASLVIHHFFTLADPMDYQAFTYALAEIAPDFEVMDLSRSFAVMAASMANLHSVADFILIGSILAAILITCLLVLLFLRERQQEIGIYLALGDKKQNVLGQIIFEVIPLLLVGLTVALVIGNLVVRNLSHELIRQEILANPPTQESVQMTDNNPLEILGYRFSMSDDEMLANYEITLNRNVVISFYAVGVTSVLIAMILPGIVVIKADPKKLLGNLYT